MGARAQGGSGRRSARQAGLAAAARRARGRLGERQQGAQGARGTAGLGVAWALEGGRLGQLGQFWCTVHLARFLDPVRLGIFLSHQMNIVHYKINFFFFEKKNNIY